MPREGSGFCGWLKAACRIRGDIVLLSEKALLQLAVVVFLDVAGLNPVKQLFPQVIFTDVQFDGFR